LSTRAASHKGTALARAIRQKKKKENNALFLLGKKTTVFAVASCVAVFQAFSGLFFLAVVKRQQPSRRCLPRQGAHNKLASNSNENQQQRPPTSQDQEKIPQRRWIVDRPKGAAVPDRPTSSKCSWSGMRIRRAAQ
jgi:hypothetical protein